MAKKSGRVRILIFALSTGLLFCGFYANLWRVANQSWFGGFQRDTESLVIAAMVKSRQYGALAAGGLLGLGSRTNGPAPWQESSFDYQYDAYLNGRPFVSYWPYTSQVGGVGLLFSLFDKVLDTPPSSKLRLFHSITALLTAGMLAGVVLWFFLEFGWTVATFVLVSLLAAQWLVVLGRNLYWSLWTFYLPMVMVLYFLRRQGDMNRRRIYMLGGIVFVGVLVKFMTTGYLFLTSTLIMVLVPFVYYCISRELPLSVRTKGMVAIVAGFGAAGVLSLLVLCAEIAFVRDGARAGLDLIIAALKRRTHGDAHEFPEHAAGLGASSWDVVLKYLRGSFSSLSNYLTTSNRFLLRLYQVSYWQLIALFLVMSVAVSIKLPPAGPRPVLRRNVALISATWISVLGPLSWFLIFKAHSHEHLHLNFIVWQLPFTMFGFAVVGLAFERLWLAWAAERRRRLSVPR